MTAFPVISGASMWMENRRLCPPMVMNRTRRTAAAAVYGSMRSKKPGMLKPDSVNR